MASNDEQRSATTIFTTAAQSIAARLIANKTTAKFTKAEISTTNLFNQSVTELQVLTSLDNVQQTADINTVTVVNNNTVNVNVAIDQTKAPNDYQMNSVGLFAVDGDGKEVLYSVTVLKDPVYIHQDAMGSALGIDLETVVGQSSNVDLSINPAGAVTNEALKVTLADYVKTDDVKSLIPATVIDGSKPADFKESVTLEKGAVDGAGNAIATSKDLSDGDATTLKSAKDYADVQAGDKVKDADTANWQKTKISADDGSPKSFLYAKDGGNITMWIAGRPLGIHTFWCAAGVTGNPVSSSIQGTMSISSVKNGVGYCVSADGDFISITLVDGQVSYSVLANAANVVDRNPDTGTVSKPTDFTNLTVNGGKSVATRDDLKSLEASAWRQLDNKYITPASGHTLAPSTNILYKIDDSNHKLYLSGSIVLTINADNVPVTVQLGSIIKSILTLSVPYLGYYNLNNHTWSLVSASQSATNLTFILYSGIAGITAYLGTNSELAYVTYDELI
ncbi:hypothetical protein [Levilactobacillus brevis]|uniref:hypothetical protein n=1 Tax=Levilactobacillus brevis TaxID=1580 RepID=UPI003F4AD2FE